MKYLIIGLGNPGDQYRNTRHNIGFSILNKFSDLKGADFVKSRYADVTDIKFKGRNVCLVKPNTFMNLSGRAVNYWMQKLKVDINNILVITDDISLPLGDIRMRAKGSDGGHNGLKDINLCLESNKYPRLRFGVGHDFLKGKQADYVLSDFLKDDMLLINEKMLLAVQMIESFVTIGVNQTMSDFNGK
jgi:PTH1 family peptidyl-tRNA hydrolase